MARLTYWDARNLARAFCFDPTIDFHLLSSAGVINVLAAADSVKYKAPKNANGSRARYFHAYVKRVIDAGEKE